MYEASSSNPWDRNFSDLGLRVPRCAPVLRRPEGEAARQAGQRRAATRRRILGDAGRLCDPPLRRLPLRGVVKTALSVNESLMPVTVHCLILLG